MSDHASLKHVFTNKKATGSRLPYESPWMAHWKQTSFNPASQVRESHSNERKELQKIKQGQPAIQILKSKKTRILGSDVDLSDISESRNTWRHGHGMLEVAPSTPHISTETMSIRSNDIPMKNLETVKSSDAKTEQCDTLLGKSLHKLPGSFVNRENLIAPFPYLRNATSERKQFPISNFSQKMENLFSQKEDVHPFRSEIDGKSGYAALHVSTGGTHLLSKVVSLPLHEFGLMSEGDHSQAGVAQSQHHQIEPAGVTQSQHYQVEVCDSIGKNRLPVSSPFKGSSSSSIPYGTIPRGSNMGSSTCVKEKLHLSISEPEFTHFDCENYDSGRHSSILVSDKKTNPTVNLRRDGFVAQKGKIQQLHTDDLKGNRHFPLHVGEWSGKLNDFPVTQLLPSCSGVSRIIPSENLKYGLHLLNRMPTCSFKDAETWRICTTVDSVEGMTEGPSKFSKTTHHLMITKKGGVNLSRGDQMTKDSVVSAELRGSAFDNLLSVPPFLGFGCERGRRFQPPGNMIDREEKKDVHVNRAGLLHIQNESSAETDPMFINVHQSRNTLSGEASSPSHKDVMVRENARNFQAALASSSKEIQIKTVKTELPDMNEEPPASVGIDSPVDDRELSMSNTESMGVEHFLSHIEQPETSISSPQHESPIGLGPEASSRWVKRLRLNASDSLALGTKSSILGDASSSRKVNELFTKIMSYSKSNSEPILGKNLRKGAQQEKIVMLLRNRDASSLDSVKECQDVSLSNAWIRRWCRNREVAPQGKGTLSGVCKPEMSKLTLDEMKKKHYPSIAAMALMGKAINNFQPCEFRKRGSLVVWKTKV